MRRSMLSGLVCLLVAGLIVACLSPAAIARVTPTPSPPPTHTPTPLPTATETLTPTPTNSPTLTPSPTRTFTPSPTASKTPTPDLYDGIALSLNDVPEGFALMSLNERSMLGLSDTDLDRSFSYAGTSMRLHNFAGFVHPDTPGFEIVAAFMYYPLTDAALNDLEMSFDNPQAVVNAMTGAGTKTSGQITARILPGMDKFGNNSIGITMLVNPSGQHPMRCDMVIARRTRIAEYYVTYYYNNTRPLVGVGDLAKILDGRIEAAQTR